MRRVVHSRTYLLVFGAWMAFTLTSAKSPIVQSLSCFVLGAGLLIAILIDMDDDKHD